MQILGPVIEVARVCQYDQHRPGRVRRQSRRRQGGRGLPGAVDGRRPALLQCGYDAAKALGGLQQFLEARQFAKVGSGGRRANGGQRIHHPVSGTLFRQPSPRRICVKSR